MQYFFLFNENIFLSISAVSDMIYKNTCFDAPGMAIRKEYMYNQTVKHNDNIGA